MTETRLRWTEGPQAVWQRRRRLVPYSERTSFGEAPGGWRRSAVGFQASQCRVASSRRRPRRPVRNARFWLHRRAAHSELCGASWGLGYGRRQVAPCPRRRRRRDAGASTHARSSCFAPYFLPLPASSPHQPATSNEPLPPPLLGALAVVLEAVRARARAFRSAHPLNAAPAGLTRPRRRCCCMLQFVAVAPDAETSPLLST